MRSALEHLYVHVPFCAAKCQYCAFYSVVAEAGERHAFEALPGRELRLLAGPVWDGPAGAPRTLYFGGGTPGLLGGEGLRALADGLWQALDRGRLEEWTVELNPATVTPGLVAVLRGMGVNRLSMGAQCFEDGVLQAIGRPHDAATTVRAVASARAAGFENLGLDLIAGLPGVSAAAWRASLERAVALGVTHVSVYALSVEAGTPLAARVADGSVVLPGAEEQLEALAQAESFLARAGLARYEISNYARPGMECRHNLACWRGGDYVGLGPSASSRAGLRRWTNRADVRAYAQSVAAGERPPRSEEETLDPEADAVERMVFGLRLAEGVCLEWFAVRHPAAGPRTAAWAAALVRLEGHGLVERTADGAWRLTGRGREVADAVLAELV
jgi:oxygen-independent coproporphyrinogen-3 oxidase